MRHLRQQTTIRVELIHVSHGLLLIIDPVRAFELFNQLGLHIPGVYLRDVATKWSIRHSSSRKLQNGSFYRFTYIFQCICGCDHTAGPVTTAKRQMPYDDVGCNAYIKLVVTFDSNLSGK